MLYTPAPPSGAAPETGTADLEPGEPLYAGSRKQAVFAVNLPTPASVEAYEVGSGAAVRSWPLPAGPGEVRWYGTVSGLPVPDGRYAFRIAGDMTARAARAPSDQIVIQLRRGSDGTGQSDVYMPMRDSARSQGWSGRGRPDDRLPRAHGPHERLPPALQLWTSPGFYTGGKAIDPLPELTRWDAFR